MENLLLRIFGNLIIVTFLSNDDLFVGLAFGAGLADGECPDCISGDSLKSGELFGHKNSSVFYLWYRRLLSY